MLNLIEGLRFVGLSETGHSIVMDTDKKVGGLESAASPMEVMLMGMMGCTAMDAVSILAKMKENVSDFTVEAEANRTDEHPRYWKSIHLTFRVYGKNIHEKNVAKAIQLSQEKYCGAVNSLRPETEISTSYEIIEG